MHIKVKYFTIRSQTGALNAGETKGLHTMEVKVLGDHATETQSMEAFVAPCLPVPHPALSMAVLLWLITSAGCPPGAAARVKYSSAAVYSLAEGLHDFYLFIYFNSTFLSFLIFAESTKSCNDLPPGMAS